MKTLTVAAICQLNDISVDVAERALANLQAKGIVIGFVPGNPNAEITLTAAAEKYFA